MAKREKSEAAEKIEKAAKEKKAGAPKAKKGNIFKRIGKWFAKFGKDFKGETKKITWPGAKMVLKSTLVVIVAIAVIGKAISSDKLFEVFLICEILCVTEVHIQVLPLHFLAHLYDCVVICAIQIVLFLQHCEFLL